jgi:glucose-6-phosphate isomerase
MCDSETWKQLIAKQNQLKNMNMREVFNNDPKRFEKFSRIFNKDEILFDFSKNLIDDETLDLLIKLITEDCKINEWKKKMFTGEAINLTEQRPVLHTALSINILYIYTHNNFN